MGREMESGEFEVIDVCYPACIQDSLPVLTEDKWIAIVSGLSADRQDQFDERLEAFSGFITGSLLGTDVCDSSSSSIIHF